jgi:hypothetical protein
MEVLMVSALFCVLEDFLLAKADADIVEGKSISIILNIGTVVRTGHLPQIPNTGIIYPALGQALPGKAFDSGSHCRATLRSEDIEISREW